MIWRWGTSPQSDGAAVRLIMQRRNRQLYRVAQSVLNDDAEAEDVVQEAYVRAFTHPVTPSDQRDHFETSR
ncbi:sigma-70-like protein [Microvirga subterranea]|uniref:Sigma-70-like protein n=1 Tax=Microvirga subterranea TaxID=186651 RepID=A0A370H523_9HYPH|nr:sigma-70-like protein [Microvirga subterranea]